MRLRGKHPEVVDDRLREWSWARWKEWWLNHWWLLPAQLLVTIAFNLIFQIDRYSPTVAEFLDRLHVDQRSVVWAVLYGYLSYLVPSLASLSLTAFCCPWPSNLATVEPRILYRQLLVQSRLACYVWFLAAHALLGTVTGVVLSIIATPIILKGLWPGFWWYSATGMLSSLVYPELAVMLILTPGSTRLKRLLIPASMMLTGLCLYAISTGLMIGQQANWTRNLHAFQTVRLALDLVPAITLLVLNNRFDATRFKSLPRLLQTLSTEKGTRP